MAKRKLLQWMREKLSKHADIVVIPAKERNALDAAYKKAEPLVLAMVGKKYPPADMKVLKKYERGGLDENVRMQFPSGVVTQFVFATDRAPYTAAPYNMIFLADAATARAVEAWEHAKEAFEAERKRRLTAYQALIDGAGYVEDIIDLWPEAKGILPAGSPPIPLGPEQIALVKADLKERKAA